MLALVGIFVDVAAVPSLKLNKEPKNCWFESMFLLFPVGGVFRCKLAVSFRE